MGKHDSRTTEQQTNDLKSRTIERIMVDNLLTHSQTFTYGDFDLIPLWVARSLFSGAASVETTVFTEADLIEESYGGVWYLPIDLDGRELLSITVNATGSTITTRVDTSLAVDNTDWTPATRISGFPSNDPQTITIKTI